MTKSILESTITIIKNILNKQKNHSTE